MRSNPVTPSFWHSPSATPLQPSTAAKSALPSPSASTPPTSRALVSFLRNPSDRPAGYPIAVRSLALSLTRVTSLPAGNTSTTESSVDVRLNENDASVLLASALVLYALSTEPGVLVPEFEAAFWRCEAISALAQRTMGYRAMSQALGGGLRYKRRMSGRIPYLVSAALGGGAVGLLVYRLAILPLTWHSSASFMLPGLCVGLGFGARSMLREYSPRIWPAFPLVALAAVAGLGAAMGFAFVLVPPPGHARLTTKELPGFSIDLPSGDVAKESLDYQTGTLLLGNIAGSGGVAGVGWYAGSDLPPGQAEMLGRAMAGVTGGNNTTHGTMRGPGGTSLPSLVIDTDKGDLNMVFVPCGNRGVMVISLGDGAQALEQRMVASFRCKPDPAREREQATQGVTVHIDLPDFRAVSHEAAQLQLTDGTSLVQLQSMVTGDPTKLQPLLNAVFVAMGAELTFSTEHDGRIPFQGTLENEHVIGFATAITCAGSTTVVFVFSPDQAAADQLSQHVASLRCLAAGEPPQWNDVTSAPGDKPAP